MNTQHLEFQLPARPEFARSVRMLAANLAVVCGMSVDDVEDLRMAAEEGFVFACATSCKDCTIIFDLQEDGIASRFKLGNLNCCTSDEAVQALGYVKLILSAVCDDFSIDSKGAQLSFTKKKSER